MQGAMMFDSPDQLAAMRTAFARRDAAQDGRFVVGVTSTGIYCRPSCPARRPRAEHCRFLPGPAEAEDAGFRPCKRCRPHEAAREEIALAHALEILHADAGRVPLATLAGRVGYSPAHFQRVFKRRVGLSPAVYARALHAGRAQDRLAISATVTDAIYEAGFSGPSRFYANMEGRLGMAPSAWIKGAAGVTIRWAVTATSLGPMLVAATEKGVCRISFHEGEEDLRAIFPQAQLLNGGDDFTALLASVVAAVEQPDTGHDIPLDVRGTAFQERVWQALRRIPAGETRSYAQIAAAAGNPKAVRAAGSANGANHVAVLIPCHRVVRSDGALGGYAYGQDIKRELLRREKAWQD